MFGISPSLKIDGQNVTDNTRQEIGNALHKIEPTIDVDVKYIELPDKPDFYVIAIYFDSNNDIAFQVDELECQSVRDRLSTKKFSYVLPESVSDGAGEWFEFPEFHSACLEEVTKKYITLTFDYLEPMPTPDSRGLYTDVRICVARK